MVRQMLAVGLASLVLSGCGDDSAEMNCPDADRAFFDQSLANYFARHQNASGTTMYRIAGKARYDTGTHWWIVPVDTEGRKLQALLSCDGRLELSGR
jgi:hypothetical protein